LASAPYGGLGRRFSIKLIIRVGEALCNGDHLVLVTVLFSGDAITLRGEAGRDAALRWGSASRPLATNETEGQIMFRSPKTGSF
jgi:hypothetical protein